MSSPGHRRRNTPQSALITGLVCGVVAFLMVAVIIGVRRNNSKKRAALQRDPEAQRAEQRRVNGGWYRQPVPQETAVERRARLAAEARASRGWEGGIEREARREREAREGGPAPPVYQLPAPTYPSTMEQRRQWLAANRPVVQPPLGAEHDAPPAYDSAAVWPTRG